MERPVHIVLGASGGIGSEVARRLAPGSRLVLAARSERLVALAGELDATPVVLDAREPAEVERCVKEAKQAHGRVDGIVNCVGSILLRPAHRTTPAEFDEVLATNLRSAFAAVRAAAPAMRETGGSIVLVSSAAARTGLANHEAIAAAKAGVEGLARAAAASYAGWGVRVNAVAPGLVRTPLAAPLTENEGLRKASEAMHPLGRIGEPGDVASAICWLLDPAQGWVTGQVLGVDGGLATVRGRG